MAQNLPEEVWSEIVEISHASSHHSLQNMSLTSRRMHRLVVPVLFRDVEFHLFDAELGGPLTLANLIRNIMRAQFLFDSPELVRHTRFFSFWENADTVEEMADYLAPIIYRDEDPEDSSVWEDAENMFAVLQDASYNLIVRMPGLRKLRLIGTMMTSLSHSAILSRPLLTSLYLRPSHLLRITHVIPTLPYAHRLRDFNYYCFEWTMNDPTVADPYLTDILGHCILDLEKLTIHSTLLPVVVSVIPLQRTLSLRSLSMTIPIFSSGSVAAAAFLKVLHASPQLQFLDIPVGFPEVKPPHHLPPPNLSNLTTFSGTSQLLHILSGGTNLVKIGIDDCFYPNDQSLTQVVRSSPTHLRSFSMARVMVSRTPQALLTLIRSLAAFRNLEKVYIGYELDIPWKDHVSAQDSLNTIKDLLKQLACLRSLTILYWNHNVNGYNIGCLLSEQGGPSDRGHPSLEEIDVDFIGSRWYWNSRTGWNHS